MKALRGVWLCGVLLASACGAKQRAGVDDLQRGVAGRQSPTAGQSVAGEPSPAGNAHALSAANGGNAGASGGAGTGGVAVVATSGMTAGQPATGSMVDVDLVTRDCAETLRCSSDSATGTVVSSLADCVATSADALNASPAEVQRQFMQTVEACAAFKSCDYVACTSRK
jgi:hypothetical protein